MNQYSQQAAPYQSGQHSYQNYNNQSQFQPTGFVHSNYQGQLSQPTFGQPTQSIVGRPSTGQGFQGSHHYGIQQHAVPAQHFHAGTAVSNHSYIPHEPVQSYASAPATAFGNVGPVIAHVGYQSGPSSSLAHNHYGQQSYYQPSHAAYHAQQPVSSLTSGYSSNIGQSYGMSQTHSSTPRNPVYQATHAYEHAGPVISHAGGYQAAGSDSNYLR